MSEEVDLNQIREELLKMTTDMAVSDSVDPIQRASLLMAKVRTEPDDNTLKQIFDTLKEIESEDIKLEVAMDLLQEIDIRLGNISVSEGGDQEEDPQPDQQNEHHD